MSANIVIAAGGTGGHLFPAQSLAKELSESYEVTFMAKGLTTNPRFNKEHYQFSDIASGPITPKKLIPSSLSILKGIWQSIKALKALKADLVIGFGSYHSFPVLVAAKMLGIPIVLHEANSVPGKVNRIFSPYAAFTGVFFPDAAKFLKGKYEVTDIPLREQFLAALRPTRAMGLEHYGLQDGVFTILIFGGSQGAKVLNDIARGAIQLVPNVQVLHFTGSSEATARAKEAYKGANIHAVVQDFEKEMQYAWAACDLCISRSGASTIAEAIAFSVPSIYIPYPFSTDAHQDKNAQYVASEGGAIWFNEKDLTATMLADAIKSLLSDEKRDKMKAALSSAYERMNARHFSDLVANFLQERR